MIIYAIAVPVAMWAGVLAALVPNKNFYKGLFDRATMGKLRDDRNALQVMLNHLQDKPEEWSISRNSASYPLEGMKQIYLTCDKGVWSYDINSSGDGSHVLLGHYAVEFDKAIRTENDRRVTQGLLRKLYNVEGPLLLK